MSLVVKRYKRLVRKLLFTHSELEHVEEILSEVHREFEIYYKSYCAKYDVPIEELNKKNTKKLEKIYPKKELLTDEEGIIQFETEDNPIPTNKVFQRMYRIVAKKLHPDKFSNHELTPEIQGKTEAFKQATNAYNKKNWAIFLDICEKYDILPTRYEKINSLIRDEISNTNKIINHKKLSFSWRLHECEENERCKDKIIKSFLFQLFKYSV